MVWSEEARVVLVAMRTDEVTAPGDGTTVAVVAGLLRSYGCGAWGAQEGTAKLWVH